MKTTRLWIAWIGLTALAGATFAADDAWLTDFAKAKQLAAEKKLPILVNFAGSDWCAWCLKLDREVFSQQTFKDYAQMNLVLMLADFPARKKLPEETAKQNKDLATQYAVKGFPTVLLLSAEGKEIARTGYRPGGAEAYVKHLKEILEAAAKKDV